MAKHYHKNKDIKLNHVSEEEWKEVDAVLIKFKAFKYMLFAIVLTFHVT